MIKKIEIGFTLVEVIITSVIIIFISGAIYYGMMSVSYSVRNAELRQNAFTSLSNKIEGFKARVSLGHIAKSGENDNYNLCIEYKSIKDMSRLANSENLGATSPGCKTNGEFYYNIKPRKSESLNAKVYDINASITWKLITRFGNTGRDTTINLNVSQLVFN